MFGIVLLLTILVFKILALEVSGLSNEKENDIATIEVIGNKFFYSNTDEQFFMKGIAYQPSRSLSELEDTTESFETKYIDPLSNPKTCLRDIHYLKKLASY